jgi:hypothetical protein
MAKQKTSTEVNEYRHTETEETLSAYVGSELDKVLLKDPDYEVVGERTPAPEETTPEGEPEPTPQSGKTRSDGGRVTAADLEGKSRDELNDIATEAGVENPDGFANKGEVTKAILEASGTPEG